MTLGILYWSMHTTETAGMVSLAICNTGAAAASKSLTLYGTVYMYVCGLGTRLEINSEYVQGCTEYPVVSLIETDNRHNNIVHNNHS